LKIKLVIGNGRLTIRLHESNGQGRAVSKVCPIGSDGQSVITLKIYPSSRSKPPDGSEKE